MHALLGQHHFSEVTNNSVTVAMRMNAGMRVTAYRPEYPTHSGNMSNNPFGFSLGSRPTGGTAWFGLHPGLIGALSSSSAGAGACAQSVSAVRRAPHQAEGSITNTPQQGCCASNMEIHHHPRTLYFP